MKIFSTVFFLLLCTASLCADKKGVQTKGAELLEQARGANDIYSIPHFYLEASVSFVKGKDAVTGSYKLYWDGKAKWRDEFEAGGYKEVRIGVGEKVWTQRNLPEMSLYAFEFRSLMNTRNLLRVEADEKITGVSEKKIQGIQAECLKLEPVRTGIGWDRVLCLDASTLVILKNRDSIQYSDPRRIGEKIFPFTWYSERNFPIIWNSEKKLTLSVKVLSLTKSMNFDPVLFQPPAQVDPVIGCHLPIEPQTTVPARPVYPDEAKMRRISGSVWIYGVVDTNGKIKNEKVVSSPSDLLNAASLDGVRQMRFAPATCDGTAVDFEQFTTINFSLGH